MIKRWLAAGLFFLPGISAGEYLPITDDEALLYLEKQVYAQFVVTNQIIENCDKRQRDASIDVTPEQVEAFFNQAGLTWQQAMLATTYIGIRNDDLCSAAARKELLFRVSTLDEAMKSVDRPLRIQTDERELGYTDLWSMALLPTIRQVRFALRYEQFPSEVKTYMEKHFGTAPFDHMKFMDGLSDGK